MSHAATGTELEVLQPASTSIASLGQVVEEPKDRGPETNMQTRGAPSPEVRKSQAVIVIIQLTALTFMTSITTGLINVAIPRMAADLAIQPQLTYW